MPARRLRRAFTRNATSASPPGLSVGQRSVYRMLAEQTILPLPLTVPTCEYDARRLRVPVIHVRTVLRKGGVDDIKGQRAAWRLVFPLYGGPIPNADEHGIEGTRWTEFVTRVEPGDLIVNTKKRLSAFYPRYSPGRTARRRRGRSAVPIAN